MTNIVQSNRIFEEQQRMYLRSEQQQKRDINLAQFQRLHIGDNNIEDSLEKVVDDDSLLLRNEGEGGTPNPDWPEDNFKVVKMQQIGSGSQADVYTCYIEQKRCQLLVTKTKKIINNDRLAEDTLRDMQNEFNIAQNLQHPNIIKYLYFITNRVNESCEFNIILEYMEGGNLKSFIRNQKKITDIKQLQSIVSQILNGLVYLHKNSIVHQDLKPQNILFSKDFQVVKLADLGVSHRLEKTKATRSAECGTTRYMSPE